MARETLLDRVPVAPAHIHRMRTELEAATAAREYEAELRSFFPGRAWPRFDLALMGMGPDAHTASLFPGTPAIQERERWVVAPWVEKFRTFRVTLTPPAINASAHIVFMVAGADKADALRDVFAGPRDPDRWPSQIVDPLDGDLLWLVDRAAASKLKTD
jgi:6-phosphogluconolactonase